jgi:hypothetical protein
MFSCINKLSIIEQENLIENAEEMDRELLKGPAADTTRSENWQKN